MNWYLRFSKSGVVRKTSQSFTIGPVYHGTPYKFDLEEMRRGVVYFSDNANFASNYGHQKSQEGQMDADITVLSAYIKGSLFDPQNKSHVESVVPYLPPKITVYNDFGMDANLPIEKWKSFISGIHVQQPFFSEKDLAGKGIGDLLPDNEVYDKPMKYEIVKITPDEVFCVGEGTIGGIIQGIHGFRWETERNKHFTKEEVANDILTLGRIEFMRKYKDIERKHYFHVKRFSRKPITTYNNDVWRWMEGDGVYEAIQKAGFDIVRSRERGKITYAVFPSAEIVPIKSDV